MAKRADILIILAFTVIVLLRPEWLIEFINRKEVLFILNLSVAGFLVYYLFGLVRNRKTTDRFFLKVLFSVAILILPILFLTGYLTFDNQTLLLYLIVVGFFYMTMMN